MLTAPPSLKKTEAHGGAIQRISGWARRAPAATLGAACNMPLQIK
jgi:hypothetical protein